MKAIQGIIVATSVTSIVLSWLYFIMLLGGPADPVTFLQIQLFMSPLVGIFVGLMDATERNYNEPPTYPETDE